MATRKKRLQEVKQTPEAAPKQKETERYKDAFQRASEKRIEDMTRSLEGRGKTLVYAIAAVAVLAVLITIFVVWNRRSDTAAQAALGRAIETSEAPISEQPAPAGSTIKTFKTEKERAEAAIRDFQAVADKYGSPVREKAQYFIAVNKLSIDQAAAQQELENLSRTSGEVGTLSKFALAQSYSGDGKFDAAARLYQELLSLNDPVIAKDTINFELAQVYEKQGKNEEAVNLYYDIAKRASEAKDAEGKPVPLSQTAREAKEKLQALDPKRAAEIKEETPEIPGGAFPVGL